MRQPEIIGEMKLASRGKLSFNEYNCVDSCSLPVDDFSYLHTNLELTCHTTRSNDILSNTFIEAIGFGL